LDVGCGRGEFLKLLKENGVKAKGIDVDKKMVDYCKKKGLNVILASATDYLKSLPDNTLDGIFMAQVIEHLRPKDAVEFIKMTYNKLRKGSYLVIETVNTSSFVGLSNFSLDPSHIFPFPPSLLEFLLRSAGFKKIEIKFLAPPADELKLKKIKIDERLSSSEIELVDTYNKNIEKLNSVIYGYQDYAIICKR
jgi:O-antigen chain-terminating methyltransferase